jgi:hypothetical protein
MRVAGLIAVTLLLAHANRSVHGAEFNRSPEHVMDGASRRRSPASRQYDCRIGAK